MKGAEVGIVLVIVLGVGGAFFFLQGEPVPVGPPPAHPIPKGTVDPEPIDLFGKREDILIEAESADELVEPMALITDPACSGGKGVEIPEIPHGTHCEATYKDQTRPDEGNPAKGTYRFDVEKEGDYIFWVRSNWHCSCGDSILVSFDDGDAIEFGDDASEGMWKWRTKKILQEDGSWETKTFKLTPGEHTLIIRNAEDGTKLDKYLLTRDAKFFPTGKEEN